MKRASFYNSVAYREKQSRIAKNNWQEGLYDSIIKREIRFCNASKCNKSFKVKISNSKKFCSRSCAVGVHNSSRSNMDQEVKRRIKELYARGLSIEEVSSKVNRSSHQIAYWMNKENIPRRTRSEATYVKRNPNGDPFEIKKQLNKKESILKGLGLGIYWGEGDKSTANAIVRVGNTDPILLKYFKEFLLKICKVPEDRIRYSLSMFNDGSENEALKFWNKYLGIQRNQLGKIVIIPPQGKGTYKKKNKNGVLMIYVCNKKLKERILDMIRSL